MMSQEASGCFHSTSLRVRFGYMHGDSQRLAVANRNEKHLIMPNFNFAYILQACNVGGVGVSFSLGSLLEQMCL